MIYKQFVTIYVGHAEPTQYLNELRSSLFALCPSGWSPWSPRLFASLIAGTIPIIFANGIQLPFESAIDYRQLSIKIADENVYQLDEIMDGLVQQRKQNIQRLQLIQQIRKSYWWRDASNETIRWDPMMLTMEQIAVRVKQRKPIGNEEYGFVSID